MDRTKPQIREWPVLRDRTTRLRWARLVDHHELRHDPVLAALVGKLEAKRKDCAPLAGQSTLNRLEHSRATSV
jgi:hypothetical protein